MFFRVKNHERIALGDNVSLAKQAQRSNMGYFLWDKNGGFFAAVGDDPGERMQLLRERKRERIKERDIGKQRKEREKKKEREVREREKE